MFDFNKLDQHKKYMEENDISSLVFGDREWQIGSDSEVFYLDQCDEYTLKFEPVIEEEEWETFKKEVANYFLK